MDTNNQNQNEHTSEAVNENRPEHNDKNQNKNRVHRRPPHTQGQQNVEFNKQTQNKPTTEKKADNTSAEAPRVNAPQTVQGETKQTHTVWSSSGKGKRPMRPVTPLAPKAPSQNSQSKPEQRSKNPEKKENGSARVSDTIVTQSEAKPIQNTVRQSNQRPPRMAHKPATQQDLPQMDNLLIEDVPKEDTSSSSYTPDTAELERILQYEACVPQNRNIPAVLPEGKIVVVGVRFRYGGKTYFFAPGDNLCAKGQHCIVETARGMEFGEVYMPNCMVDESLIVPPLRPIIRIATDEDIAHNRENQEKETEAYRIGVQKIQQHKLDMKLVTAQYTFDNSKLLFYFTSAGRVDFRELVRDLASVFHIRIELRQIGIRDEARMIGGLGACGRPLCCAAFLSDFGQVSMKMAKEQNISLNSTKISGACGRLMCCLRYEYDTYQEEISRTPAIGTFVITPDGTGVITEIYPLSGEVKVSLRKEGEITLKRYKRELVTVQAPGVRPGENGDGTEIQPNEAENGGFTDSSAEDSAEPDSDI